MRRDRRFLILLAGVLAVGAQLTSGHVVGATTSTSGGGALNGTLTIPYPCVCTGGGISATAAMSLSGLAQSGGAYSATWPDPRTTPLGTVPTNFTTPSGMNSSSQCVVTAPVPPLNGSAGGGFTLSGGLLVVNGTVWDNATLTGNITWQWVSPTVGVVMLTGATISGGAGPSVVAVTLNLNNVVVGSGIMSFTWSAPMGNCSVQNPNQTALIQAALGQPA